VKPQHLARAVAHLYLGRACSHQLAFREAAEFKAPPHVRSAQWGFAFEG
jgi:hypothetical protein